MNYTCVKTLVLCGWNTLDPSRYMCKGNTWIYPLHMSELVSAASYMGRSLFLCLSVRRSVNLSVTRVVYVGAWFKGSH